MSIGPFGITRSVQLHCPHPPDECVRRLVAVTSLRGHGWFLDPKTGGLPDPRLRGTVSSTGVVVSRFEETLGRNSFVAVLDASIRSGSSGGTELSGAVRLPEGVRAVGTAILAAGSAILSTLFAVGVYLLVRGPALEGLPPVLVVLVMGAGWLIIIRAGLRSHRAGAVRLIDEVSDILDVQR